MILGIGTDMASVDRLVQVLTAHDARFVARCFADEERDRVEGVAAGDMTRRAAGYAKRWAAKEACAKALGTGVSADVFLKDMVVVNDDGGRPSLDLRGGAAARLQYLTPAGFMPRLHLSISDEAGMAMAFVVISAEPQQP
ncbi:MAG: holo-ACP synthase [Alphaproteobacteria bacterium]|nr:holo-ACP synthase [Alphaproteobacteria bacterium]